METKQDDLSALTVVNVPPLTQIDFSAIRRRGIGGSDISAILGLDPYRTPHNVWAAKMGLEKYEQSEAARWGVLIEPLILQEYAEREHVMLAMPEAGPDTPYRIDNPHRPRFLTHKTESWIRATVDAIVKDAKVVVDAKTKLDPYWSRQEYGEPGTDHVPVGVILQSVWYCGVLQYTRADIPVLMGNKLLVYRVPFNARLWEILVDRCRTFWTKYVLTRTPPPLEDPGVARKTVEQVYPRNLAEVREATDVEGQLVNLYRQVDDRYDALDAFRKKVEAAICARIATADGLKGEFGKLLWKRQKDSPKTDWEAVAWKIATEFGIPTPVFDEIKREFTKTKEGVRVFKHYWRGETDEQRSPAIEGPATTSPDGDRRALAGQT